MASIWPDTFVEEGNLVQNISVLRKTLGEHPSGHPYIETVPKQGYRFLAEVTVTEITAGVRGKGAAGLWLKRSKAAWAIGLAACLAIVYGVVWLRHGQARSSASVLSTTPFTSHPGLELHPSFSPDGNQIAFAWNGEKQDNFDIYVKLTSGGQPLQLTRDAGRDFRPAWSPDGRSIAFLRDIGGRYLILVIPAISGTEVRVGETRISPFAVFEPYLEWTPDSKSLAVTDMAPEGPMYLSLISVQTGEKTRLTNPGRGGMGDFHAAFSLDGRTLAFVRVKVDNRLCLTPLSTGYLPAGEPKCSAIGDHFLSRLVWTPDGRDIIFAAPTAGRGRPSLWRTAVSRTGEGHGAPQRLVAVGESSTDPVISRDGKRFAYTSLVHNSNIWRIGLGGSEADRPVKVISSTHLDGNGRYSPDGSKIAFLSTRSGRPAIWVSDSDGGNPVQLTSFNAKMTGSPRWSPDGESIVFDSNVEGQSEIYVMHRDGGRLRRVTDDPATEAIASWSRDGRSLYFFSTRSGRAQIWKAPAAGGDPVPVTRGGGGIAFESTDGKFVYYAKAGGVTSLWRVPVDGGEEVKVLDSVLGFNFTVAERGIYFMSQTEAGPAILFFDFATSKATRVALLDGPVANGLSLSPDGRFLIYSRYETVGADLMLVEDFR